MLTETIAAGMIIGVIRVVAFAIAGLLAYFGYKLFFAVPNKSESGGKIETPGLTITLSRIAPGTFFAICGAGIVIASFIYPMKIDGMNGGSAMGSIGQVSENREPPLGTTNTQPPPPTASLNQSITDAQRAHFVKAIQQLNCLRTKTQLKESEVNAIDQARVALMARLWIEDWGNFQAFETWALEGRGDPPVTRVQDLFTQEDPRCTH